MEEAGKSGILTAAPSVVMGQGPGSGRGLAKTPQGSRPSPGLTHPKGWVRPHAWHGPGPSLVRVVLHHWVFLASTTPLMNGLVGPLQSFIHVSSDIESRSKKTTKKQNTYCNHLAEFCLLYSFFGKLLQIF